MHKAHFLSGAVAVIAMTLPLVASPAASITLHDDLPSRSSETSPIGERRMPLSGERTVVLQPIGGDDAADLSAADADALSASTLATLNEYYGAASAGHLTFSDVFVQDVHRISDDSCNSMQQESYLLKAKLDLPDTAHFIAIALADDCRYPGLGRLNGNWAFLEAANAKFKIHPRSLVHEMGHNLGLPHASGYPCYAMSEDGFEHLGIAEECAIDAYGDPTDPMGKGFTPSPLNPMNLHYLGWGDGIEIEDLTSGARTFTLAPDTKPNEKDATIFSTPDGLLMLSYRISTGVVGSGVALHEIRNPAERVTTGEPYSTFISFESNAMLGRAGSHYISPSRAVAVHVEEVTSSNAIVTVKVSPAGKVRDSWAPRVDGAPAPRISKRNLFFSAPIAADASPPVVSVVKISFFGRQDRILEQTSVSMPQGNAVKVPTPKGWARAEATISSVDQSGNTSIVRLDNMFRR